MWLRSCFPACSWRISAGGWLLEPISRPHAAPWLRITAGALLISLLMSLPWIGGITQLLVFLVGFGALVLERRDSRHQLQPTRL
jgi:apolipoprotein N-acyltransferase